MQNTSMSVNCYARRAWSALILCVAVLLSAGQPAAPAHADPGYAYYWSITFDFEHNFDGVLSIITGYNDNGAPEYPPIHEQTTTIPCRRVGNAQVAGGVLMLNGGYIQCDFDLHSALRSAFNKCNQIVAGCAMSIEDEEHYAHFRTAAQVLSTVPGEAPIFYHEDASYRIHPNTSGTTGTKITADLAPYGVIASTSAPVPPLSVWTSYHSFYSCAAGCGMEYWVAGHSKFVPTALQRVPFSTEATTIYIGYDPVANLAAPAGTQINMLFVDPPNHGNH